MAFVYSSKFLDEAGASGDYHYTVPAGYLAVVRYFGVTVGVSALGQVGTLYTAAGGRLYILGSQVATLAAESFYWEGRVVYSAGADIHVNAYGTIDFYVGGFLLSLP